MFKGKEAKQVIACGDVEILKKSPDFQVDHEERLRNKQLVLQNGRIQLLGPGKLVTFTDGSQY
jgi:hypothetical protein